MKSSIAFHASHSMRFRLKGTRSMDHHTILPSSIACMYLRQVLTAELDACFLGCDYQWRACSMTNPENGETIQVQELEHHVEVGVKHVLPEDLNGHFVVRTAFPPKDFHSSHAPRRIENDLLISTPRASFQSNFSSDFILTKLDEEIEEILSKSHSSFTYESHPLPTESKYWWLDFDYTSCLRDVLQYLFQNACVSLKFLSLFWTFFMANI